MESEKNGEVSILEGSEEYFRQLDGKELFSEMPVASSNPFVSQMSKTMSIKNKKTFYKGDGTGIQKTIEMADYSTGEIKNVEEVRIFRTVDKADADSFVKIYLDNVRPLYDLSLTAVRVLFYVFNSFKQDKDTFYLSVSDCMRELGWRSSRQVYTGVSELIKKQFIARTPRENLFFINPNIVFNGKRLMIIQEVFTDTTPLSFENEIKASKRRKSIPEENPRASMKVSRNDMEPNTGFDKGLY